MVTMPNIVMDAQEMRNLFDKWQDESQPTKTYPSSTTEDESVKVRFNQGPYNVSYYVYPIEQETILEEGIMGENMRIVK